MELSFFFIETIQLKYYFLPKFRFCSNIKSKTKEFIQTPCTFVTFQAEFSYYEQF